MNWKLRIEHWPDSDLIHAGDTAKLFLREPLVIDLEAAHQDGSFDNESLIALR